MNRFGCSPLITRRYLFSITFLPFVRLANDSPVWAVRCKACAAEGKERVWIGYNTDSRHLSKPARMTRKLAQERLFSEHYELVFWP